jgi:hypothetical protein
VFTEEVEFACYGVEEGGEGGGEGGTGCEEGCGDGLVLERVGLVVMRRYVPMTESVNALVSLSSLSVAVSIAPKFF